MEWIEECIQKKHSIHETPFAYIVFKYVEVPIISPLKSEVEITSFMVYVEL